MRFEHDDVERVYVAPGFRDRVKCDFPGARAEATGTSFLTVADVTGALSQGLCGWYRGEKRPPGRLGFGQMDEEADLSDDLADLTELGLR